MMPTSKILTTTWQNMSSELQLEFRNLVEKGGEVHAGTLPNLLARSKALAYAVSSQAGVVAVAGLKNPNSSYRARVFQNAKSAESASAYPLELGWVFVEETERGKGLSRAICAQLLEQAKEAVYATSASDNDHIAMHSTLKKLGFKQLGSPYKSSNGRELLLFGRSAGP